MLTHERILAVRAVASRPRVCTSTVYKRCAEGRLAHVQISDNAIRVRPEVLEVAWPGRHESR